MAKFVIEFSPPQKNKSEPDDVVTTPVINYCMKLAPFQKPTQVEFNNIKLKEISVRFLTIINPLDKPGQFVLPPPSDGIHFGVYEFTLESNSQCEISITWQPSEYGNMRKLIKIEQVNSKRKYDFIILGNCNGPPYKKFKGATSIYSKSNNENLIKNQSVKEETEIKPLVKNPHNMSKPINAKIKSPPIRRQTYLVGEKENFPLQKKNSFSRDTILTSPERSLKRPDQKRQDYVFNNHFSFRNLNKSSSPMSDDSIEYPSNKVVSNNNQLNDLRLTPLKSTENLLSPFCINKKQLNGFDVTDGLLASTSSNSPLLKLENASNAGVTENNTPVSSPANFKPNSWSDVINPLFSTSPECRKSSDFGQNYNRITTSPVYNRTMITWSGTKQKRPSFVVQKSHYKCSSKTLVMSKTKQKQCSTSPQTTRLKTPQLDKCDQHLKTLTVPELFYHNNVEDPFIKMSQFYEEEWLNRQESDMIRWLNALLTPTDKLVDKEQSDELEKAAMAWIEASKTSHKNKPMQFATQKDLFAAQIYRQSPQQWSALRKATTNLITSTNVSSVLSKLTVSIEKDLISVRDDRQIHLDISLKKKVFDLLKCYNPLWIRIGLEAIFGQIICVKTGSNDLDGVGWFVRKNLFNNDYVKQKFTKTTVLQVNLPSYNMAMNKFILRKIMMLIYFLDRAKEHQLIRHNPCLFKTDSPYKSSHDLLIGFCADMVTAHGDIVRRLRSMGYCLTHKQTHLDEVNYAVKSLADLRDGTRITKAVEILFKGQPLSQKLRLPAISKLQKIHNVNLAINRISQHISIEGNISTRDVVNGHREKILSLFWQIIYKYLTPRYNDAAAKIQNWWRNSSLKLVVLKRIRAKQIARRHSAAAKIQAHVRGHLIRKHWPRLRAELVENREMLHVCATKIKHYLKRKLRLLTEDRKRFVILRRTVVFVQRKFRHKMIMVRERRKYLRAKRSAMIIQKVFRGFALRKNWPQIANEMAAEKNKRIAAADTIKRALRRNLPPTRDRVEFLKLKSAVANVQRLRAANRLMKLETDRYSTLKSLTVFVQRKFRAKVAMQKERETYLIVQRSVLLVQKVFRGFAARKRWPDTRNRLLSEKKKLTNAANVVKRALRRNLPPTRDRLEFLKLKSAVANVQSRNAANKLMKSEKKRYAALKSATLLVQRKFRAKVAMRRDRETYLKVQRSVLLVQKVFRGFATRKRWPDTRNRLLSEKRTLTNAANVLKRALRRNLPPTRDRREFLKLKRTVTYVQSRYVANRLMKSDMERYSVLKNAAVTVQRKFRANIAMRRDRETYLKVWRSVLLVQKVFRGFAARKRWPDTRNRLLSEKRTLTNAANVVKRALRRNLPPTRDQLKFLELKRAVNNVRIRYAANKLMKSEKERYGTLKSAAVLVQRKFRAKIAMRRDRETYFKIRRSIVLIQKVFRGFAARKRWPDTRNRLFCEKKMVTNAANVLKRALRRNLPPARDRLEFLKLKRTVTYVQSRYVANKLMKSNIERYSKLKSATLMIQSKCRANIAMRRERERYLKIQRSVVLIQKTFRGFSARKRWPDTRNRLTFEKRKRAAASNVLKRALRRNLPETEDRSRFVKLKRVAVFVQRTWRANSLMRDQRELYTTWQRATVFVQRKWRAELKMRVDRSTYLKTERAALLVQKVFRGFATRKRWPALRDCLAAERAKRVRAADIIKRFLRKNLPPTQDAVLYSRLKRSVVAVQRRYRANLAMRSQRESFLVLKYNTIIIQERFRANQAMAAERNLYGKLRIAVVCVQQRFRANATAKLQRAEYKRVRWAAIVLQTHFRARRAARAAVVLQAHIRGFLARRRWPHLRDRLDADRKLAMKISREKNSALKDQQKTEEITNAAIIIQTFWRGYCVRKKHQCRRETVRLPNKDTLTIAKQHHDVLAYMVKQKSNDFSYKELSINLWKLDMYTSLSYVLCAASAQGFMVDYIFRFLQYSNQSQPSIEARIPAVLVLTNLLKYHGTSKLLWGKTITTDINKVMIKIMKSCCGKFGSANELYCTIATWFWIALQDTGRKLYIKKIPNINVDMKSMMETLNRKYKTRQMDKKMMVLPTTRLTCSIGSKCQKRFVSDLYATIQICKTLNIK